MFDQELEQAKPPIPSPWRLQSLGGKHKGKEFALPLNQTIILGRSPQADVVIEDDKASRQHAKLNATEKNVSLTDLDSSNGTFVNSKKVKKAMLKGGEKIRIGTFHFKLIAEAMDDVTLRHAYEETLAKFETSRGRTKAGQATKFTLSGSLREISLVDMLQLLCGTGKSGVLTIREAGSRGKIFLHSGQIRHVTLNEQTARRPEKTLFRLLRWNAGTFELEPAATEPPPENITESSQSLLLEGVQQVDELARLENDLPPLTARLLIAKPLPGPLRLLTPVELDLFQLSLEQETLLAVLDHFAGSDLDAYTGLLDLIQRQFIKVA